MRLIDADAFDKCLEGAEIEATKNQKYVFSSAINTIRGNLANFPTVNQWIPVYERLPDDYTRVLTTNSKIGVWKVDINSRNIAGWIYSSDPVAWMPLPEPYKEKKE